MDRLDKTSVDICLRLFHNRRKLSIWLLIYLFTNYASPLKANSRDTFHGLNYPTNYFLHL
jgi:hypothetical protein